MESASHRVHYRCSQPAVSTPSQPFTQCPVNYDHLPVRSPAGVCVRGQLGQRLKGLYDPISRPRVSAESAFEQFPRGLPCKTRLLPDDLRDLRQVAGRTAEREVRYCKVGDAVTAVTAG